MPALSFAPIKTYLNKLMWPLWHAALLDNYR